MPSSKDAAPSYDTVRRLPPDERLAHIVSWWPSKSALAKDLGVVPSTVSQWLRRGISSHWIIPLLRAIERRHGLVPIRLSKVPAARRAATRERIRELQGLLSIDWSVIEPMLADRQTQEKVPQDADTEK